jgi:5-deoxy-glucuronate isomerase
MQSAFLTHLFPQGGEPVPLHPDYKYIRYFRILNLAAGESFQFENQNLEMALLILEGHCSVKLDSVDYGNIVSRENIFKGLPYSVYIPIDRRLVVSGGPALIALFGGLCETNSEPALITPRDIEIKKVGTDNWSREVRLLIGSKSPAVNIILGETLNPPGNWSGTPPHKHAKDDLPRESLHEEIYYFRIAQPQGWGIQRLYSPERGINELLFLQDQCVSFMPWGYHQVAAAPGYPLYYTFFLAGRGKSLTGFMDPDHSWILNP